MSLSVRDMNRRRRFHAIEAQMRVRIRRAHDDEHQREQAIEQATAGGADHGVEYAELI